MTQTLTPDICVIGGGSGGLSLAAAAAAFGVDVVLIEKHKMGGDCLNYGCVPSKAMLAAGKQAQAMRSGAKFGIANVEPDINFADVNAHVKAVIGAIAPNDSVERFTSLGVHVIEAEGKFRDEKTVIAGDFEIKARRFVISTGSSPMVPPIPGLDEVDYITNETLFEMTQAPEHLIVIGGGPIGLEMAQAHRRLGSKVTVIEAFKALGKDDRELTSIVLDNIRLEGVDIREDTKVVKLEKLDDSGVRVHVETSDGTDMIDGSHVLVAVGRKVNVDGLDLEKANIEYDRRGVKVTDKLRSTNKRVYAIGDVAGGLQFTHVAGYHAGLLLRPLLFRLPAKINNHIIPWVTYCDPELAHVGMNEEQAEQVHGSIEVLRWSFGENDRAQAEHKTQGLIKMVVNKKGKILGVSIAGANAGEMINMWALALSKKMSVRDIASYVSPYPTMSEIGKRAAVSFYGDVPKKPFIRKVIGFMRKFG